MSKSEFDGEFLRLVEEFNTSAGAVERRSRILGALDLRPGDHVLDVGAGPGHQVAEIAPIVAPGGLVKGVRFDGKCDNYREKKMDRLRQCRIRLG